MMKNIIWKYADLEKMLKKEFPLVRRWAFEKLAAFYGHSHLSKIADLIDDKDDYISSAAVRYLSEHGQKKWAFRILRKFQESSGEIAASCAVALGQLGFKEAISFFKQRIESEEADFETLMGIISALRLLPSDEATDLLLLIGELYATAPSGAFMTKICDALLATKHRDAVHFIAELYMEHSFSLDDRGNGILRCITQHTDSMEFIDEFRIFIEEHPHDILKHIKEHIRKRLGEILGDEFIKKTAEKFLKNNYLQLFGDIRKTAEMALYSRKVVSNEEEINSADILSQELFNYHFISRFANEPRLLNVMSLSEVKKVIILSIASLLRIIYPQKSSKIPDIQMTDDIESLIAALDTTPDPNKLITLIDTLADTEKKVETVIERIARKLKSNGKTLSTIRCMKTLAVLMPEKCLEIFWERLGIKYEDSICQVAEDCMVSAGKSAVDFIAGNFKSGDESQKMFSLGILSRIPIANSVNLIIDNFGELWDGYRDFVLYAVNELGSRQFIKPVLSKLEESPMPDTEETYLLLSEINDVHDERLKGAYERVLKELKSVDKSGDDIRCNRSKALRRSHCNRKLICRQCDLSLLKVE